MIRYSRIMDSNEYDFTKRRGKTFRSLAIDDLTHTHTHRASTSAPAGSNWKRPSNVYKNETNDNASENDEVRRDIFWLEDRSHRLRPHRSRWLCDPVSVVGTNLNANSMLRPKRYVGTGLVNLGNTCFLNSVLQLLLHTPYVVRYVVRARSARILITSLTSTRTSLSEVLEHQLTRMTCIIQSLSLTDTTGTWCRI